MKTIFLTLFICALALPIRAQQVDQNCDPLAVPRECEQFADSIRRLETRITNLQARLSGASPGAKADLMRTIRTLTTQRDNARAELNSCLLEHGATQRQLAASELNSNFTGTATLRTSDGNAAGPFNTDVDIDFRFTRSRCNLTITNFPTIRLRTRDLPVLGRVNVSVTLTGRGRNSFHPITGELSIPITLHFHYDTALLSDDDASFILTTERSTSYRSTFDVTGSRLAGGGAITLVGTTRFRNGYLADKEGSLVITANLSPQP